MVSEACKIQIDTREGKKRSNPKMMNPHEASGEKMEDSKNL